MAAGVSSMSLIGWFILFSASYRYAGVIAVVADDNDTEDRVRNFSVSVLSPTSAMLEWRPPTKPGVARYRIQYRDEESFVSQQMHRDVSGEDNRITINDLLPKTVYSFSISAKFVDGALFGPPYRVDIETWPNGEAMSGAVPTGAPQNFTAIGMSPTGVLIQWDPPAQRHRNGKIVLYEVVYHQETQANDEGMFNATGLLAIVDGLEPATNYNFQIRAYTAIGPGPWSNRLPFRPFPQLAPRITVAPTDQKVDEDGTVSFFCRASGNPKPEVYWRRAGERITTSNNRYAVVNVPQQSGSSASSSSSSGTASGTGGGGGSVLRIEMAKPRSDDAVFECVAESGYGDPAVATAKLDVYPEGQAPAGYPRIVESPTLKAVEKDRNTVMLCSASGNPEPTITWFKDYIPVDTTDPRLKVLPTGSLEIRQSLEADEGKYECVAENSVGVDYSYRANLYVRVRRVPPHFSIPPEHVEVMPGGSVNLTCVAIGSPMPYVKWRLGALELTPEDNVPIGKNVLMLNDIRESATYTCVASSDHGKIESDAEVKVKENVMRAPLFARLLSDTSVMIYLYALAEPVIRYYVIVVTDDVATKHRPDAMETEELKNAKSNPDAWIAARFDSRLPSEMGLGDGMEADGFTNYPLQRGRQYRVFVRAYTSDTTFISTEFSPPFSTLVKRESLPVTSLASQVEKSKLVLSAMFPVCVGVVYVLYNTVQRYSFEALI